MQGGPEVDRVQAADGGRADGLGQDPDGWVQVDQLYLVQHCRQPGDRIWCVSGQRAEGLDLCRHRADPPCLGLPIALA